MTQKAPVWILDDSIPRKKWYHLKQISSLPLQNQHNLGFDLFSLETVGVGMLAIFYFIISWTFNLLLENKIQIIIIIITITIIIIIIIIVIIIIVKI